MSTKICVVDLEQQDILKQAEIEFLLTNIRVSVKKAIDKIEAGSLVLSDLKQDQTIEIPRWAAEELEKEGVVEVVEEPFEVEVFKALSKEKLLGSLQLSKLPYNFYMRMRRYLILMSDKLRENKIRNEDYQKLKVSCYDLVSIRIGKLLSLANSSINPTELSEKVTAEELIFFKSIQELAGKWKKTMLGDI